MRINQLEITKFRGIKELIIKPNGENVVIVGQNGTGKSGVVDALDFLFTGRISRLTGEGTGDISLREHGRHIDDTAEEASVAALIVPVKDAAEVKLARVISMPSDLFGAQEFSSNRAFLELVSQGHHMLSRREILKFIATEPKHRSEQVQALLNISDIERVRKLLGKIRNEEQATYEGVRSEVNRAKDTITSTVGIFDYDDNKILDFINKQRKLFKGSPIAELKSSNVRLGIKQPFISGERPPQVTGFNSDVHYVRTLAQAVEARNSSDDELREAATGVRAKPEQLILHRRANLIQLGMSSIPKDGSCPLCNTKWKPGELKKHLAEHLKIAKEADQNIGTLERVRVSLSREINLLSTTLKRLTSVSTLIDLPTLVKSLSGWDSELLQLLNAVQTELHEVPLKYGKNQMTSLLAPAKLDDLLDRLTEKVNSAYPDSAPEQNAWETLTLLEAHLKSLESIKTELNKVTRKAKLATKLLEKFLEARDSVLNDLYHSIENRFAEFYRYVHGADEQGFTAELIPEQAALNLVVDFYGRGMYSPQALHSEGHQDSMGLCLYLALVEKLTGGVVDLVILDDVLMSVDSLHRKRVCSLIKDFFKDYQFVITTHDEIWANQLVSEGVVSKKGRIEFYDWDIETGPKVNYESDFWIKVDKNLEKNDVPAAAALLRRGSEFFFATCCELLKAEVVYKGTGRYTLGDFLPAANGKLRKLIRLGKDTAHSWGDTAKVEWLTQYESNLEVNYSKANAEGWAINENVHFNEWMVMNRNDFSSVVNAYAELYKMFECPTCNQTVRFIEHGFEPRGVECACKNYSWSLVKKGRPDG